MAATPTRIGALVAIGLATVLLGVALFSPWWGFARESEGQKSWERYGPFQRDDRARDTEFRSETNLLGWLTWIALGGLALAALVHLIALARRRSGASVGVGVLALLLVGAAVLYPVFAFPAEASRGRDEQLSFIDRDCYTFPGGSRYCYVTQPDLGWYLALAAGVLVLAVLAADLLARSEPEPEVAAPGLAASPVAVVRPRAAASTAPAPASSAAPTRVTKCPQCQTRVSYRKPFAGAALAECHNCGLRFPA
jgi:hypothetical protein